MLEKNEKKNQNLNSNSSNHGCNILRLLNFVTAEEIEDKDEENEILKNVMDLITPFGLYQDIKFLVEKELNSCQIIVHFHNELSAKAAETSLQDLVIGGQPLTAICCSVEDLSDNKSIHNMDQCNKSDKVQNQSSFCDFKSSRIILYLENLVFSTDVIDEEETSEILKDIQSLCERHLNNNNNKHKKVQNSKITK